jgi:hypothetical protein
MTFKNRIHPGLFCLFDWPSFEKEIGIGRILSTIYNTPLWSGVIQQGINIFEVVYFLPKDKVVHKDVSKDDWCSYFLGVVNNQTFEFLISNAALEEAYDKCIFDLSKDDDRTAKFLLILETAGRSIQ